MTAHLIRKRRGEVAIYLIKNESSYASFSSSSSSIYICGSCMHLHCWYFLPFCT